VQDPLPASTRIEVHEVSVVVPVYQGEHTLGALAAEIAPLVAPQPTPDGRAYRVAELVLVHDGAVDGSAEVMAQLASSHPFVRVLWLSRNFGQHAATLAGMASTASDWVATIDEDGQQDPRDIGRLLDTALAHGAQLVYAKPSNQAPHSWLRNLSSRLAKSASVLALGNPHLGRFNSFRLIRGEIARGVAAYCGANVYLDVALSWVVAGARHCPVRLRGERRRTSGYTPQRLLGHFWQLVITSGTRPLRVIALLGLVAIVLAVAISALVVWRRLEHQVPVQGWTSMIIVVCLFAGLILVSLGVIAEYLGVAVSMAMGKPPYLLSSRPVPGRRRD
jgi:undecaprenyl-phosphate 4-deoxy-4-formamido-L-arabinose transferase